MTTVISEQNLIEEMEQSEWTTQLKFEKIQKNKKFRKASIENVLFVSGDNQLHVSDSEYENLIDCLNHFKLIEPYQNLWVEEHAWGVVCFHKQVMMALLNELSIRCSEDWAYEQAWEVSRDMVTFINKLPDHYYLSIVTAGNICFCKSCRHNIPWKEIVVSWLPK